MITAAQPHRMEESMTYHVSQRGSSHHDQTEYDTCGHRHRSMRAAIKCMDRLCRRYPDGTTSAKWYNADIRNDDGSFAEEFYAIRDEMDSRGERS
jgi:hypothetical protein